MQEKCLNTTVAADVQSWLVEKIASRMMVPVSEVNVDHYFDEFGLDSTEALVLSGELERWLGFEIETTALWYHPTIASLSAYIAEESRNRQNEHASTC